MHDFLVTQALLIGYGSALFCMALITPWLPFRLKQLFGWSSLVIFGSVVLSFFVPEIGRSVLFVLNNGVKALWSLTE